MAASNPTPRTSKDKKVWDQFMSYARKRNFDPLEASTQQVQDWLTHRAQTTGAGPEVEHELQCLRRWRHNAGKPLGPLLSEAAIAQGLLGYLDPLLGNIKGFLPLQLQELLKVAVTMEGNNKFGALRQMSLYVLHFWGVARFSDVQNLKIGQLLRGTDYYHLSFVRHGLGSSQKKEVIQIFPTPTKFHKIFCPVTILSHYCKIRAELAPSDETSYLFPKLSLSFEQEATPTRLRMAAPEEPIPRLSFYRKFKSHVESAELQKVGVNSFDFTPDSLTLGGKNCLVNGVVCPDFDHTPNELIPASNSSVGSLKRPHSAVDAIDLPEFGIPINRKAPVLQVVEGSSSSSEGVKHSAPEAAASASNFQQVRRSNPPQGSSKVTSQVTSEETPARVIPNKHLNHLNLGLKLSIRDRLSRFPQITVTKAVPPAPSESPDPPLAGLAKMNTICDKWSHLWR